MYDPGDIVQINGVDKLDDYQRPWLSTATGDKVMLDLTDYADITIETVQTRLTAQHHAVVCIPGTEMYNNQLCSKVALDGDLLEFTRKLIEHYYEKTWAAKERAVWFSRWKKASVTYEQAGCHCTMKIGITSPSKTKWCMAIAGGAWIMPVCTHHLNAIMNDDTKFNFFPNKITKFDVTNLCCYRAASSYPKKFQGRYTDQEHDKKSIVILLHGFINPLDLHSHYLAHPVGRGDAREKEFWAAEFNGQQIADTVFNAAGCTYNAAIGKCINCKEERFKKVHKEIKESLNFYSELAVTFFENATTKVILRQKESKDTPYTVMKLVFGDFPAGDRAAVRFKKLGAEGICFNWNDNVPIIHARLTTLYFRNICQGLMTAQERKLPLEWIKGLLSDVKRTL